jgi:preprotein translocase subunit SecD
VTAPDEDDADETVVLDDPSEARYQLGPVEAPGTIIEDADAQLSPNGEWQIALAMTSEGIEAFNAMASRCSPPSETCPTGQVAIVLDSEVLSAPTVQAPSFGRGDIVIAGSFTEEEAKDLAVALRYGSLPTSLELIQDG